VNSDTLQQLCRPEAFDHPAQNLTLRETHISWVILCGEFAYKIKKPVDFGFLDFSTLERRRHFCELELKLNRRFAPELYLAVVPITEGDEGPEFEGEGTPIEYAVKMRRFDEEQLLDNIASRGKLDPDLVRSLARELARLHSELPSFHPEPGGTVPGTPAALEAAFEQNFQQLRNFPLPTEALEQLEVVESWTRDRYRELRPCMQQRIENGRVIDGHGDVHLGNITLIEGKVTFFDCIEFNPDFRIIDSVGELGLLTMDLHARGHPEEAHQLLTDYLEYRGDFGGLALLDLYRSYFAMVRAKVNLLWKSPGQSALESSEAYREMIPYLGLALRYCQTGHPFLVLTHGVSGSGKSTVAAKVLAQSGAVRIRSDVERKRLFGLNPEERSHPKDESALYSRDMTRKTFDRLEQLAILVIQAGFPIIVDATFLHRFARERFCSLAEQLAVPFAVLDCGADPTLLRQRLVERDHHRRDASEANIAVMASQQEQLEPLSGVEQEYRVEVNSGEEPEVIWKRLQGVLYGLQAPE